MFKKFILAIFVGVMLITLTGCGKEKNIEGSLEDIMTAIYKDLDEDTKSRLMNIELTDENIANFLGTSDIAYKEALASENLIGSIAYSVILVRTESNANVEAIKSTIKENINPRKWICVWVEKEDVIIKNKGDLIIVIVVKDEENRNIIEKGFDNL